jgi:integrase
MRKIKEIKVRKTQINGERYYYVAYPTVEGRKRLFFKNRGEAETKCEQLKTQQENHGTAGMSLTERQRAEYIEYSEQLREYGATLRDAVAYYLPILKARRSQCTVKELSAELLKAKAADGASARYLKDIDCKLRAFLDSFNEAKVGDFSAARIDDWLRALPCSAVTRNGYKRVLGVFFSFAVQRGLITDNPARKASRAKVVDKPPGILTPEQAARLIEAAEAEIVPALALGLFAGLRPEAEVWRLDWQEIDFESGLIRIEALKTKSARHRLVEMTDNLKLWLMPHRKHVGPVSPKGDAYFTRLERARAAAGISEWPQDALRHCYGTYHYAKWQDPGKTMVQMGHTNPRTFHAHYRARVSPAAAAKFWAIEPLPVSEKIVAIA